MGVLRAVWLCLAATAGCAAPPPDRGPNGARLEILSGPALADTFRNVQVLDSGDCKLRIAGDSSAVGYLESGEVVRLVRSTGIPAGEYDIEGDVICRSSPIFGPQHACMQYGRDEAGALYVVAEGATPDVAPVCPRPVDVYPYEQR